MCQFKNKIITINKINWKKILNNNLDIYFFKILLCLEIIKGELIYNLENWKIFD